MRLRRKPEAKEFVRQHPRVINDPKQLRGQWRTFLQNDRPLHVELGTGKGKFLSTICSVKPNFHWIGVERVEEVLMQALKKADEQDCSNLHFLWMDIAELDEVFDRGEVARFYLHFSDPWPKKRHAKRRLTHRDFLAQYQKILGPEGELLLKTDHRSLYEFTLEELAVCGYTVLEQSEDLHRSPYSEGNIMTEYEEKFVAKGMPIYYLLARPPAKFPEEVLEKKRRRKTWHINAGQEQAEDETNRNDDVSDQ
ncbi:tRNA (guanosine(46)-N7)-methyltransferase TrmB [Polycladomyces subterraneus]|uniref:tRNA (guanine-N(7)-)-methyltransferase n=1 Tax=Polycladomyces subterraneus TaxID=1016997 RepID=A0ABT8IRA7_9BACL|nr:tRNA (guanosine(46)-N7)-methyltransferase TrmB [Polycladomyces subterraneus]MDN4595338.1 tRNA (guanosine(46)-N7)-methyltransferase TrmB [Polycladomyces subterraneus]